jgi:hypothetical protein
MWKIRFSQYEALRYEYEIGIWAEADTIGERS